MFERKGQYFINELEEETFDKQLPSASLKIPYIKKRQKILNINQQKFQLDLIRQKIYQKCRGEELQYLDQLEKQKQKFIQLKKQQEKNRKSHFINLMAKKYEIQDERQLKQLPRLRDSIDQLKNMSIHNFKQNKIKQQFSLEPNQGKKNEKFVQNEWVNRVRQARNKLENKLGKYYHSDQIQDESDSQNSSISESKKHQMSTKK